MRSLYPLAVFISVVAIAGSWSFAADGEDDPAVAPASGRPAHYVAPASDEAANAMKQFKLPPGWKVDLFAAEPRVANPVCLSIDDKGRVYVVETFRRRNATLDIRKIQSWLDDDLACRTVADRIAMVKRHMPNDWHKLEGITDRIRVLTDTQGTGHATEDHVFADKFDKLEDGTAAGVLAWGDKVYFTDIPNLWLLKDSQGKGVADKRESLAYGFGVRYNYSGHDMHGLRMGPDGRIYFSIADRGFHVEKDGKVLDNPDSGAVLRCEPDGSHLEIVHTGLRNPQELAFDEYGNLFTADNNSDAGDPSRWVYVVEGGDSGWHVGWQWLGGSTPRGPWMSEELCQVQPTKYPVYYRLPPIATPKIAGPAGLTYSPGTGLPKEWDGRFYLVDFRGGAAGGSGIYTLKNKVKGASFELEEMKELVTGVLPTDVEFAPNGKLYFTDWVTGWEPMGKGRVYTLTPPGLEKDKSVAFVEQTLRNGVASVQGYENQLLASPDVRIRLRTQFLLASSPNRGGAVFAAVLSDAASPQLAKIHSVWGLGQILRHDDKASAPAALLAALESNDTEVRAQAAKMLGDAKGDLVVERLTQLLADRNARVRFFAAMSLGKLRATSAGEKVLAMLRKNNDSDAYLRHAGMMALLGMNDEKLIAAAATDDSPAARVAALLVYRRQLNPKVAQFLDDVDPGLVLEAARAINDVIITDALPKLAAMTAKTGLNEPILVRALNANYRLGGAANAKALAAFASRNDVPANLRAEALQMLGDWAKPSGRDRVTGLWRPVPERSPEAAKTALAPELEKLLATAPDAVRLAALKAGIVLGANTTPLYDLAVNEKNPAGLRAAAIAAMGEKKDKQLAEAAKLAMASKDSVLRIAAVRVQPRVPDGMKVLADVLASGTPREQQAAVQTAAAVMMSKDKNAKEGESLLQQAMTRLEKGTLPVEAQLDLLEAAAKKKSGKLADRRKAYEAALKSKVAQDPLAENRDTLAGGDPERGGMIFRDRADVSCMRCHSINKVGGNAGPDLAGVLTRSGGAEKGREYILESILYPSKKIAQGFETVALRTNDGDVIAGLFKSEDAKEVTLDVPNVGLTRVPKANIKSRQGGLSAMPDDIAKTLSKDDLRDLVEFLAVQ